MEGKVDIYDIGHYSKVERNKWFERVNHWSYSDNQDSKKNFIDWNNQNLSNEDKMILDELEHFKPD